jgi:hypothetical protein
MISPFRAVLQQTLNHTLQYLEYLEHTCAGYLEPPYKKIGDVCQVNQEGANLCSMHMQAEI